MLEDRGLATVVIGAVRAQMERTRPPRGLWTSSQLGRPLGEPGDPAFQLRVLKAALALLDRSDGPVILEDFHDDPPGWTDNADWRPPSVPGDTSRDWRTDFGAELWQLMALWHAAQERFGRTTVGLSSLVPDAWADFAPRFIAGELPVIEGHATSALSLRLLCDDIKAFYGEAAQALGPPPSARQVDTWFWRHTVAGRLLQALRVAAITSETNALKTVGGRFFVPAPWVA
jgi:hypothetical protein